jgi:hypothetical protein
METNLQIHHCNADGYKNIIQKSENMVLKAPFIIAKYKTPKSLGRSFRKNVQEEKL